MDRPRQLPRNPIHTTNSPAYGAGEWEMVPTGKAGGGRKVVGNREVAWRPRPEGAPACSHGWSEAQPVESELPPTAASEGQRRHQRHIVRTPLVNPPPLSGRVEPVPMIHGFRCAPPVATHRGPDGADRAEQSNATCSRELRAMRNLHHRFRRSCSKTLRRPLFPLNDLVSALLSLLTPPPPSSSA